MENSSPIATDAKQLAGLLLHAPHDFVRELNADNDRLMLAESLTRSIAAEHDLRFRAAALGNMDFDVFCEVLPWDTEFFGYKVAKLQAIVAMKPYESWKELRYDVAVAELLKKAKQAGVRYLFTTVDTRDLGQVQALSKAGFTLIETRSHYHRDLTTYAFPERYAARAARSDDVPSLCEVAMTMINPSDRFHADPFITHEQAMRMMRTWVKASIDEGFADVTIVPDTEDPKGFCTVKYHKDKWERWGVKLSQPVFSAVSTEAKGWYRKIISEINYHLKEAGSEHVWLITQANNIRVISVWESLGFRFGRAEHVLRMVID